jgi:7-keto-8-aminopelargonate synthetase-like enzyme
VAHRPCGTALAPFRIWLIIDGLYSMFGDFAPFEELARMLDRWPQLHLYVDDAHATGWLGTHGRGGALTQSAGGVTAAARRLFSAIHHDRIGRLPPP